MDSKDDSKNSKSFDLQEQQMFPEKEVEAITNIQEFDQSESNRPLTELIQEDVGKDKEDDLPTSLKVLVDPKEGGEWDLLLKKLSEWQKSKNLKNQIKTFKQVAILSACLLLLVSIIRIYGGFINGISKFPIAPGLLELAGTIWLIWFTISKLLRSKDRQNLVSDIRTRRSALLGDPDKETQT